ncbi:MAG: RsmD family RNA methyltransferase [Bacteroidales bacterium]|nr:RsmD family RNA methyltransferase [Bacteroidales bacterium]
MRIVSGKYKGKKIRPPSNFNARPTTDFAKEALFNIIENNFNIDELSVLDLFSGTGSITYEFASRGALRVSSVEMDPVHFRFIKSMVNTLDMFQVNVVRSDALKVIKNPWEEFDIVFADPPYDMKDLESLPELVLDNELLTKDGWLILEHPSKMNFNHIEGLFDHRSYGSVNFSFFKKPGT